MTEPVGPSLTRLGDAGPAVRDIRDRLRLTGDLVDDPAVAADVDQFDTSIDRAVRAFQQRRSRSAC